MAGSTSEQRLLFSPYPFELNFDDFDSSAKLHKRQHIAAGKLVGEAMAVGLFTPK